MGSVPSVDPLPPAGVLASRGGCRRTWGVVACSWPWETPRRFTGQNRKHVVPADTWSSATSAAALAPRSGVRNDRASRCRRALIAIQAGSRLCGSRGRRAPRGRRPSGGQFDAERSRTDYRRGFAPRTTFSPSRSSCLVSEPHVRCRTWLDACGSGTRECDVQRGPESLSNSRLHQAQPKLGARSASVPL